MLVVRKEPRDRCQDAVENVVSSIRRKIRDGYIEIVVTSGYWFVGWRIEAEIALWSYLCVF